MYNISALDLGFYGNLFTGCNKRGVIKNIRKRLDRMVMNLD